jgi:hypothetical protein
MLTPIYFTTLVLCTSMPFIGDLSAMFYVDFCSSELKDIRRHHNSQAFYRNPQQSAKTAGVSGERTNEGKECGRTSDRSELLVLPGAKR